MPVRFGIWITLSSLMAVFLIGSPDIVEIAC
jgi:hypothetical protein